MKMASDDHTADDVAIWMLEQVQSKFLYQDDAAYEIDSKFGSDFVYYNDNANPAINKTVLKKFKALSGDVIVWSRSERLWRKREAGDAEGRMQE